MNILTENENIPVEESSDRFVCCSTYVVLYYQKNGRLPQHPHIDVNPSRSSDENGTQNLGFDECKSGKVTLRIASPFALIESGSTN
jgi:hypothetical protein